MIFLYPLFYYGAYIFFVIMINSLIVKRGYAKLYTSFFLFIYVVGMLPASHILYFLIINRSLVFTGIQSAYREFDPGNIPGSFFSLFKSTGGLWGGVWAILMLLFFFFFFISIDLKTKNGLLDIFAVTFPFSLAISKLACFSGGCCHGKEGSGFPFICFSWVNETMSSYQKTLFPVQLLDALLMCLCGLFLLILHRKQRQQGSLILWFILLYSVSRFFTEFLRGDTSVFTVFGLRLVQFILIFAFIVSVILLWQKRFYQKILSLRSAGTERPVSSAVNAPEIQKQEKRFNILLLIFGLLFPFYLSVCLIPLCINIVKYKKNPGKKLLHKIFRLFVYSALGLLTLSSFLIISLIPVLVILPGTVVGLILLMKKMQAAGWLAA